MSLVGRMLSFFAERRAKGKGYEELAQRLQQDAPVIAQRMARTADTPRHREVVRHVTGIERWGQRRLRSILGEPLVIDEYDGYRPADQPLPELQAAFQTTRADTLTLLRALQQAQIPLTRTVPHNELGPLTLAAWFIYLADHAARETRWLLR